MLSLNGAGITDVCDFVHFRIMSLLKRFYQNFISIWTSWTEEDPAFIRKKCANQKTQNGAYLLRSVAVLSVLTSWLQNTHEVKKIYSRQKVGKVLFCLRRHTPKNAKELYDENWNGVFSSVAHGKWRTVREKSISIMWSQWSLGDEKKWLCLQNRFAEGWLWTTAAVHKALEQMRSVASYL